MSRPLFHPESEEEEEEDPLGETSKPNFFGDTDDENEELPPSSPPAFAPLKRARENEDEDDDDIIEEIPPPLVLADWKARSPPNAPSSSSAASEDDEVEESSPPPLHPDPPKKRRRFSPPVANLKPDSPPPQDDSSSLPQSSYLGEMIVADAWATTTGNSLLASGDSIHIHKELKDELVKRPSKESTKPMKGKQMTLTSMMKKAPAKLAKKQVEGAIVRFSNYKGQEIGRLPSKTSAWVSRLLDNNVVDIRGVAVECPTKIQTGCHIMLSLRFYLRPSAFIKPSASLMYHRSRVKDWDLMPEGAETAEEKNLSDRKRSLNELFDALSLRPRHQTRSTDLAAALSFTKEKKRDSASVKGKKRATEVVGEGEDAEEVELEGEELTGNELDAIYKKAQLHDREMPEMDPASTFTMVLRPYQCQALRWMHSIESGSRDARDADSMHPLWDEYVFPPEASDGVIDLCQDEVPFYFNPYSGELSLEFPRAERNCRGGILADEMGMGKSIMTSSLIHTSRNSEMSEIPPLEAVKPGKRSVQGALNFSKIASSSRQRPNIVPGATLIVAPLTLLSQWKSELERSSKTGTLKAYIYHGTARADLESLAYSEGDDEINVVITSYGTLSSEHAKLSRGGRSSFYEVNWLRVVLDEAHYIKSRHTKTAKACYALRAHRRWCLTGTPIVNRLEDLHSLLHFLRDEPWSDFAFFKSSIITPFLNRDTKCLDVVQIVLESILLRREKTMKDRGGRSIVSLPPKEVKTEKLEFSQAERRIYESIYADAKHAYEAFNARGVVGKNMSNILAMLMKLRQAVLHPSLIRRRSLAEDASDDEIMEVDGRDDQPSINVDALIAQFSLDPQGEALQDNKAFAIGVLKDLKSVETKECPLCLDTVQDPVLVPECHHVLCKECIVDLIQDQEAKGNEGFCPVCQRKPVTEQSLIQVAIRRKPEDDHPSSSPTVTLRKNDFVSSTKLDALVRHLRKLREEDPAFRAIVFSQFTGFLDLIRIVLQREGFREFRLDGSLNQKQRTQVLQEFAEPTNQPKIFAISLKAGGVGLNLTNANHVFMMDSWWNSAVEQQAIDRVHRIGQTKPVFVTHFIISRTIEERIVAIQKRKTAIVKSALGKGKSEQETFENLKIMFAG